MKVTKRAVEGTIQVSEQKLSGSALEQVLMDAISRTIRSSSQEVDGAWLGFVAKVKFSGRRIVNGVAMTNLQMIVEPVE